jgi:hypothetical protein
MELSPFVTKHCTEKDFSRNCEGSLRVGTLSDYRKIEANTGLLSDKDEGRGIKAIEGDFPNFTGYIAGDLLSENHFSNVKYPVAVDTSTDCNLFCVSEGPYNKDRHFDIVEGNSEYNSNIELRYFIQYDKLKLCNAIGNCLKSIYNINVKMAAGKVTYATRDIIFDGADAEREFSERELNNYAFGLIFRKPHIYRIEDEFRLAFFPEGVPPRVSFTTDLPVEIRKSLIDAIVADGSI